MRAAGECKPFTGSTVCITELRFLLLARALTAGAPAQTHFKKARSVIARPETCRNAFLKFRHAPAPAAKRARHDESLAMAMQICCCPVSEIVMQKPMQKMQNQKCCFYPHVRNHLTPKHQLNYFYSFLTEFLLKYAFACVINSGRSIFLFIRSRK